MKTSNELPSDRPTDAAVSLAPLSALKKELSHIVTTLSESWKEVRKELKLDEEVTQLIEGSGLDKTWQSVQHNGGEMIEGLFPKEPSPVATPRKARVRAVTKNAPQEQRQAPKERVKQSQSKRKPRAKKAVE